jgi:hypothetical protein
MWKNNASLVQFLLQSPPETNYVLLANDVDELSNFERAVTASNLPQQRLAQWQHQLYYCPASTMPAVVSDLLLAWTSPMTVIDVEQPLQQGLAQPTMSIPRLDCLYAWCSWPVDGQATNVSYKADPCQPVNTSDTWLVFSDVMTYVSCACALQTVLMKTSRCPLDQVLQLASSAQATGIILVAAQAAEVVPLIGDQVTASGNPGNLVVTAVAYNDGLMVNASLAVNTTVVYTSYPQVGLMAGLDRQGRWFELGWEKYAYLMMLGWQAQVRVSCCFLHVNG